MRRALFHEKKYKFLRDLNNFRSTLIGLDSLQIQTKLATEILTGIANLFDLEIADGLKVEALLQGWNVGQILVDLEVNDNLQILANTYMSAFSEVYIPIAEKLEVLVKGKNTQTIELDQLIDIKTYINCVTGLSNLLESASTIQDNIVVDGMVVSPVKGEVNITDCVDIIALAIIIGLIPSSMSVSFSVNNSIAVNCILLSSELNTIQINLASTDSLIVDYQLSTGIVLETIQNITDKVEVFMKCFATYLLQNHDFKQLMTMDSSSLIALSESVV